MLVSNYNHKPTKRKLGGFTKQNMFMFLFSILYITIYAQPVVAIKYANQVSNIYGGGNCNVSSYKSKIIYTVSGKVALDGNKPNNVCFMFNSNLDTIATVKYSILGNTSANYFHLRPLSLNTKNILFYSGYSDNYGGNTHTHVFATGSLANLSLTNYRGYKSKNICYGGLVNHIINDSVLLVSRAFKYASSFSTTSFSLWWLNNNLDTLNQKIYINNSNSTALSAFNLSQKELLVSGPTDSIDTGDTFIMKLDSVGNVKWANSYGTTGQDGFGLTKLNNQFYLVGSTNIQSLCTATTSEIVIAKIANNGNIVKEIKIETDHFIGISHIVNCGNSMILVGRSCKDFGNGYQGFFLKIDTNGIVQKQYVIGKAQTGDDTFYSNDIASDSLKNIYCAYETWTGSSVPRSYLLKLDSNLVGCYPSEPAFNFTTTVVPGYLHNIPIHFRVAKDSLYEVFGTINQGHGFNTLVDECSGYVGLKDLATSENIYFKVYPNPSAGVFYYDYNSEENNNSSATLTIIDMLGKVIIKGEINSNNSTGKIDLSELTNGIYFINVSTATKQLFNNKLSVNR